MLRIAAIVTLLLCSVALLFSQNAANESSAQPQSGEAAHQQKMRVSGAVMLGLVEHKTMPVYPDEAMTKGIQGDVFFKIDIDETGKIVSTDLLKGDPLLVAASTDALRNYHFRPYLLNGAPVRVETELGYHFSLDKNASGINGRVDCITSIPDRRSD